MKQTCYMINHCLVLLLMCVSSAGIKAEPGSVPAKLIREDRVWEYAYRATDEISAYDKPGAGWEIIQMKFDGTEMKDGVEYARFCTKSVMFGTVETEEGASRKWIPLNVSYDDPRLYLMREENGKAWTWVEPEMRLWELEGCTETLVYDIAASDGETVDIVCGNSPFQFCNKLAPPSVVAMDYVMSGDINIGAESCREVSIEVKSSYNIDIKLIEGLGFVRAQGCTGVLAVPQFKTFPPFDRYPTFLLRQYDTDGNVLYENRDLTENLLPVPAELRMSEESGVRILPEETCECWYTLQGLQVVEPQPGQLLIRVAGGRAEKVRF